MPLNQPLSSLKGPTQANRPIRLRVSTEQGVGDDLLMVKHVSGVETICGGIEYRLLCVSSEAGLPLKQFNAAPVELQFVTDTGGCRSVCGIVAQSIEGESDGGLASYQLIVRDALGIMERRLNTRIFRNASETDITGIILREWQQANPVLARAFDFVLRHVKSYPARKLTMQYTEPDAAFLRRLWKRRGLAWFFQPGQAGKTGSDTMPAHALVLFDDVATLEQNASKTVRYHRDDGTEARDSITAWHAVRALTAGRVTRQSGDYLQARCPVLAIRARSATSWPPASKITWLTFPMRVSAGRKLLMRATDGISLFAHKLGMKLIAASGKVEIQAHQENIELTSAKRIVLSASDEIVIQAPKVSIITQGAQATYGGGAITYRLTGEYAINSATFAHRKPGDSQVAPLTLPKSAASHDQRVRITDLNTGAPIANQRYRAKLEDGQEIEGTTDAQGLTKLLKSSIPFGRFSIEAIED